MDTSGWNLVQQPSVFVCRKRSFAKSAAQLHGACAGCIAAQFRIDAAPPVGAAYTQRDGAAAHRWGRDGP
jgi:hypothetical protein